LYIIIYVTTQSPHCGEIKIYNYIYLQCDKIVTARRNVVNKNYVPTNYE